MPGKLEFTTASVVESAEPLLAAPLPTAAFAAAEAAAAAPVEADVVVETVPALEAAFPEVAAGFAEA